MALPSSLLAHNPVTLRATPPAAVFLSQAVVSNLDARTDTNTVVILKIDAAAVTSIAVTPVDPHAPQGTTKQFVATAEYADGTTKDISSSVIWTSSSAGVATINSSGRATGVAPGTANIRASLGSNYGQSTLTVDPRELLSIAVAPEAPAIPRGSTQAFTATGAYSDGTTSDLTPSATWISSDTAVATIDSNGIAPALARGTTTITATAGTHSASTVLTVGPSVLTVRAPSLSFVYGDVIPATFTPSYEGLVGGDTQPATSATCTSDAHTGSGVGTYTITCSGADDPNYTIIYAAQPAVVTPRPLVIQPTGTQTYGSDEASVTPTYVGLADGDPAPETPPTCTNEGTTLVCTGASDPNYAITYATGTLTITPADLTVQAPSLSIPYGDEVPATFSPSYLGLANGDTAPDTLPTCTTTAPTGSPAGGYPITCTGAVDTDYVVTHAPGTLTITRVQLTVQAPSGSKTYGEAVPALAPNYEGLVNGDEAPETPATCSTTASSGSPTGSYPVTCTGAFDPNYEITESPGTLVVSGAGLIVQAPSVSKAYGDALPDLPPSYIGLTNGDTAPSVPATCSTPATATSPAGTYPVTCSGASDPDYEITYGEGTLIVAKVPLTVQAPSASKAYGDPMPALTPSYTGLTNGDAAPATPASCSTTADIASAVGAYPVTCSGADDTNYDIGSAQGILTVTKVTVTVSVDSASRAYGQANPPLGATYDGFVLEQTLATSGVTGSPSCTTSAVPASGPGTYPVTCTPGSLASGNYGFTFVAGILTVTKLGTALVAKPAAVVPSLLSVKVTMSARLTSLATGLPIAGQPIRFALGGSSCNATTNADGQATCSVSVLNAVWLALGRDYHATYAGTANYLPSSATGQAKLF